MRKEWEKNRGSKGHGMISNKNLKVIFGTQEEEQGRDGGGKGGEGGGRQRQEELPQKTQKILRERSKKHRILQTGQI